MFPGKSGKWLLLLGGLVLGSLAVTSLIGAEPESIKVYKTATCGCCKKWVEHLKAAGFSVTAENVDNLPEIRERYGVPDRVRSCHTALVGKYVIEGHVPADLIKKILKEKPAIVGLSVAGMPLGSPGMEGPDPQPYNVVSFDSKGQSKVYARISPQGR